MLSIKINNFIKTIRKKTKFYKVNHIKIIRYTYNTYIIRVISISLFTYSHVLDDIWASFHLYGRQVKLYNSFRIIIEVVSGINPPNDLVTAMYSLLVSMVNKWKHFPIFWPIGYNQEQKSVLMLALIILHIGSNYYFSNVSCRYRRFSMTLSSVKDHNAIRIILNHFDLITIWAQGNINKL